MKKFAWGVLGTILLVLTVLATGCAKAPPAEQPKVTTVQGILSES